MKKILLLSAFALVSLRLSAVEIPPRVNEIARKELTAIVADPMVISAISEQNAKGASLAEIQAHDKEWMATPGIVDFMKKVIDSPLGNHMREWRKSHPYVAEIIVMDNQGANVAISEKTSDYWQGDEAKFIECFKDDGHIFIDKMKFDDSTQTYSVQVSIPVRDSAGKLIGAVCFGIDVEKL